MSRILYIYGYGGGPDKSATVRMLKGALDPGRDVVICREYCQSNCPEGLKNLKQIIDEELPDVIVAASLGAFFALSLGTAVPMIIINPCMEPCKAAAKAGIPEQMCESFRNYENSIWDKMPAGPVRGYFGLQDELFGQKYKEAFRLHFGPVYDLNCPHHINDEALTEILSAIREMTTKQ